MKGYVAIPIRLPTGELTGYIGIAEANERKARAMRRKQRRFCPGKRLSNGANPHVRLSRKARHCWRARTASMRARTRSRIAS